MSYFFEKIKIIFKKSFFGPFYNQKKSRPQNGHIFRKKIYNLILNVFLHLCNYYILCHIFLKKLKSFLKNFFVGHFITKKNPTSKWTFFSKKKFRI